MGYGAYTWANRINHPIFGSFRNTISKFLERSSNNQKKRASLVFKSPKKNWRSHILSQEQYLFSEKELDMLLIKKNHKSIINEINSPFEILRLT